MTKEKSGIISSSGMVEAVRSNFSVVLNTPVKEIPLSKQRLVKREGNEEKICLYIRGRLCQVLSEEGPVNILQTLRRKESVPLRWGTGQGTDPSATGAIKGGKGKEMCLGSSGDRRGFSGFSKRLIDLK